MAGTVKWPKSANIASAPKITLWNIFYLLGARIKISMSMLISRFLFYGYINKISISTDISKSYKVYKIYLD